MEVKVEVHIMVLVWGSLGGRWTDWRRLRGRLKGMIWVGRGGLVMV